jgi:hypothetical protein
MTLDSDGSVTICVRALASFARIQQMTVANAAAIIKKEEIPFTSDHFGYEAEFLDMLWRK